MVMTKEQIIAAIEKQNAEMEATDEILDIDACATIAKALVELGVVKDDGKTFDPNMEALMDYPECVKNFVEGMCFINPPGKPSKHN